MSVLICMLELSFFMSLFLVTGIYFCSKTQFSFKKANLADLPVIYLVHLIPLRLKYFNLWVSKLWSMAWPPVVQIKFYWIKSMPVLLFYLLFYLVFAFHDCRIVFPTTLKYLLSGPLEKVCWPLISVWKKTNY